ncbi:tannase/feruloyl esterase family alpha/beta hydrolase [Promicromonospora sp. NPDC057138]|uniref:tannase/feruloyl esterase family alpha/beta hydrolase n=1 Tax=Promicromonospora sp. NPDC057138 TaxID=3346031 RepID=UPI00363DA75F
MRKKLLTLTMALAATAAVLVPISAGAAPLQADRAGATPRTSSSACASVAVAAPSGARVVSVTADARAAGTYTFPATPLGAPAPIADVPDWCDITVTLTHPGADDRVAVKVGLPQDRTLWTGRFQAVGGGGYQAGDFGAPLVQGVKDGYATASTDAGVKTGLDASWSLTPDGSLNQPLLTNFASRSVHDLAVVGKDVTKKFYATPASYSYWNGCSTGGRQGYAEAQEYPRDFQGILADAPAVSWDRFAVATLWPQVVFHEEGVSPTKCELGAFNTAAVAACDTIDGVRDGIIDNPQACRWDPRELVGTQVDCDGQTVTISAGVADAVRKIWAGPVSADGRKLWYGPNKGADFSWLATPGQPFPVANLWVKNFVERDLDLDTTALSYADFERIFRSSQAQFHDVIGSDDPDLSPFARAGGKLLSWHGQSDQLVPTQGTVDYRQRVERRFGGPARVDNFYRLFLLPGVEHCGGGPGAQPTGALDALVNWVEKGQAPATLATSATREDGTVVTRDVCSYPKATRYTGGDPASASNYHCTTP